MSERPSRPGSPVMGLYIHVPYCLQRCSYCDFFTMPLGEDRDGAFGAYLKAVTEELSIQGPRFAQDEGKASLSSIFLGGGTPSLLRPDEVAALLDEVGRHFSWSADTEITLEVNPETVDRAKAAAFLDAGINRVSMGVQSLNPASLQLLGRHHDPAKARRCYDDVRAAGVANVSLDMIYGYPGSTPAGWAEELRALLAWEPSHLSLYELILEPGTPMTRAIRSGEMTLPSEDERLVMYRLCREVTGEVGMEWYEISNYATPGCQAIHNLDNWRGASYLGVGPGAHSYRSAPELGARRANPRNMPKYLGAPAAAPWHPRELQEVRQDILLNGLRLREGLARAELRRYGRDFGAALEPRLAPLIEAAYLQVTRQGEADERWLLTPRGAELLDSVVAHFDMAPL